MNRPAAGGSVRRRYKKRLPGGGRPGVIFRRFFQPVFTDPSLFRRFREGGQRQYKQERQNFPVHRVFSFLMPGRIGFTGNSVIPDFLCQAEHRPAFGPARIHRGVGDHGGDFFLCYPVGFGILQVVGQR